MFRLIVSLPSSARIVNFAVSPPKVAVHRLRRRFADALRSEVGQTLSEGEDVDVEMRYLFQVLGGIL